MKVAYLLPLAATAAPTTTSSENLITSPSVTWELEMDSVMGGGSLGYLDRFNDHIHFSGQLDLVDGGFATFYAHVGEAMVGYQGLRISARTSTPERQFDVSVSPDYNDLTWYHRLPLETEYKSFEVFFENFFFAYHGRPSSGVPPPSSTILRKVRINISDGKPEAFEADFNVIQADDFAK